MAERLHGEIAADYTDMVYAATRVEIDGCRKAFIGDDFRSNLRSARHLRKGRERQVETAETHNRKGT